MLNLAILCSRRAPGLEALLADPLRGVLFDVKCVVTSSSEPLEIAPVVASTQPDANPVAPRPAQRGEGGRRPGEGPSLAGECVCPELIVHPIKGRVRTDYDAETAHLLTRRNIDAVVLLGYLHILTTPMLLTFRERIVNLHDADLALRNDDGGPRYPGLHSTRDAIFAGEVETRSSAHIVTEEIDAGPVLARSEAFPVAPFAQKAAAARETDIVRAYAYAQREWMMRRAWGTLVVDALQRLQLEAVA